MSSIDVIVVNWNSGEQLRDCLTSIIPALRNSFRLRRVVVVDNASNDNSLEGIDSIELPVHIIRNNENCGFAAACNQGAKGSVADYLLFLNPDTIMLKDSLEKVIAYMEARENAKVGILGIQLLDEYGRNSRSCARFPSPGQYFLKMLGLNKLMPGIFRDFIMTDWDHNEVREVDHVIGAFYLIRRNVFEDLEGFDEKFFVYLEDLDFSYRASKLCWKSVYYADAQAFHKGGGISEQIIATRLFYSLRSKILYSFKHFSKEAAAGVTLGTLFIEPISRIVLGAARLSGSEIAETVKAYIMLWRDMPNIIRRARGND